jgi:hypothetical protein
MPIGLCGYCNVDSGGHHEWGCPLSPKTFPGPQTCGHEQELAQLRKQVEILLKHAALGAPAPIVIQCGHEQELSELRAEAEKLRKACRLALDEIASPGFGREGYANAVNVHAALSLALSPAEVPCNQT